MIQQLLKSDLILSISDYTTNAYLKNFSEKYRSDNDYRNGDRKKELREMLADKRK